MITVIHFKKYNVFLRLFRFCCSSFIPIAGALKRLIEWHNGHAVFVKLNLEISIIGKQLAEFGHCQVVSSCEELVIKDNRWTGKISLNEPVVGFYLFLKIYSSSFNFT